MPDALMGEEILAYVAVKPGAAVDAEEIISFCQARLAKFKCPKEVRFVSALPKSPIGKILRRELRARVE
jgi:acyl-coenzyme A synthetase/AMP-(fatty) acid ligase